MDAVQVAHEAGIIHRDLKPDNVLVSADKNFGSRLRVLDFGLAKLSENGFLTSDYSSLTKPETIMGAFGYMPPEQLCGEPDVAKTVDLFAVRVIIYEALNGNKPFAENKYQELLTAMTSKK